MLGPILYFSLIQSKTGKSALSQDLKNEDELKKEDNLLNKDKLWLKLCQDHIQLKF